METVNSIKMISSVHRGKVSYLANAVGTIDFQVEENKVRSLL